MQDSDDYDDGDYYYADEDYPYEEEEPEQPQLSADAVHTTDYYTIDLTDIQIAGNVPSADEALTFGLAIGPSISGTGVPSLANNTIGEHSNNSHAKAAGLVDGDIYRTSDGTLRVVYS